MSLEHDHENEITYFARANFRGGMTKFGIKTDDRRRHMYIIGKTGMGKTALLKNIIMSDINAGHGCCYVDPHGDMAEELIDLIPSWRVNDVVYFNPADIDYPVGFNILEAVSETHKHLVASGMMGVFKKIWENMWSARMEYILNNTILALLDNPGSTLLGINRMYTDPDYRNKIISNVSDPVVKAFWVDEYASWSDKFATEAVAAIQNKIGQFLSSSVIRNIVAQVKSTINIREVMDSEKIFIVNLSKGRIGEDNSKLLGGMLITKMQLSAMERVDMDEADRKDFYLFVDEFQNFAVESFASILSEARKYRLCLIMAHQYIAQLTDEVREAVFGNVGTTVAFRVGAPDATFMEKEFTPRFIIEDIINIPKYNIYLKLLIDGVTSPPFSASTLPPFSEPVNSSQKVIRVSRERYAKRRTEIEEKIVKWSGMGEKTDEERVEAAKEKKKSIKESRKPKHEYNCTRCEKHMVLPVELDRSRPIYCEDCIEVVREERKNKKGKRNDRSVGPRDKKPQDREKRSGESPREKSSEQPKIKEAKPVELVSEEPSISLSALAPKIKKEKKDEGGREGKKMVEDGSKVKEFEKPTTNKPPTADEVPTAPKPPINSKEKARPNQSKKQEANPLFGNGQIKPKHGGNEGKEKKEGKVENVVKDEKVLEKNQDNDHRSNDSHGPGSADEDGAPKKRKRKRRRKKKSSQNPEQQNDSPDRSDPPEQREKSMEELFAPKPDKPAGTITPGQTIVFDD